MDILEGLNSPQRDAVTHLEGPLLILAGPGSGKTRVIAHRIAYLIQVVGLPPHRILAVTFTNKAAREMKERVHRLVGQRVEDITLGTFHATCARWLRIDAAGAGLDRNFSIYDGDDQLTLMKQVIRDDLSLDPKRYPPRAILDRISKAKAELITPEGYPRLTYFDEVVARAYERYQDRLAEAQALDFDDLLARTVQLFQWHPEVLEKYQSRYLHVMVDEFQDTNIAQYVLARQLAEGHHNICVVGDPDQSIYSWRSADIRNILNFERDNPGAKVIYLEQNYRSTQTILDTAHSVIAPNVKRKEKRLWTDNERGVPVTMAEVYNESDEAQFVVGEIQHLLESQGQHPADFAVMYRTNAQSRALEEAFVRFGLPYRLVGATRFYERREVKDLLAYLRLMVNPFDSLSLSRAIDVPKRGIGQRTQDELQRTAQAKGVPLYTALQLMVEEAAAEPRGHTAGPGAVTTQARHALADFLGLLNGLMNRAEVVPPDVVLEEIIGRIGYEQYLKEGTNPEERWENVQELVAVAREYADLPPKEGLSALLESIALVSPGDDYSEQASAVTLITLHAAKGLEFPVVFITGIEENVLPHRRSIDDPDELEEERRLFYVGITRAKKRLYLIRAFRRSLGSFSEPHAPSRFLLDIPPHLVRVKSRAGEEGIGLPAPALPPPKAPFQAGDHVRHSKFGEGIVVSCQPSGEDQEVVVAFKGEAGIKKLLLSFAPLEKVGPVP